jgi:outer membrane protein TolC
MRTGTVLLVAAVLWISPSWAQNEGTLAPVRTDTVKTVADLETATGESTGSLDVDLSPRKAVMLSMDDAVTLTLNNSMDIKINRIEPQNKEADIVRAESEFDWTFTGRFSRTRSVTPSASALAGAAASESDSSDLRLGLEKKLVTGGSVSPNIRWSRSWTNSSFATLNPNYPMDAYVSISQPLLRNAGVQVNKADIYIACNNARISKYDFKSGVINVLGDMQRTYWDLVFSIEDLDVKRKSLRLTKDTLDQTIAQVEAGLLAPIEITRVRADVAAKEEVIITARKIVRDNEDRLRRFINREAGYLVYDIGVVPLERAAYQARRFEVPHEVREALVNRPDYLAAVVGIRNRNLELVVAKNAQLPLVDVSGTLSMNGLGRATEDAWDTMKTNHFHDWTATVDVEVPLGNREAKAGYLQARLANVKSLLELKNLEHDIIITVKAAVRQVDTNLQRIRSTRLARVLAQERLEAEQEKFNVGTAQILDVLEAQTLLAEAESSERRAIVDYNKSLISLEQAKGTLLERNSIHLSEEPGPQGPSPFEEN